MPAVYGADRPGHCVAPGAIRQFLVSRDTGATALSVIPSEWQPGYGPSPHQHPHEEVFLFLEGTGEGEVGGQQVAICPGAAVIIPPHTTHWFRNTGQTAMRQVVVLASPDYTGPGHDCPTAADPRPLICLPR